MIINDLDGYYIVFDTKNWNTELDTLVKYINKVLQWFVLHESLHGLIACQTQLVVERCSSTVTV